MLSFENKSFGGAILMWLYLLFDLEHLLMYFALCMLLGPVDDMYGPVLLLIKGLG